jgi:hypothetical protein
VTDNLRPAAIEEFLTLDREFRRVFQEAREGNAAGQFFVVVGHGDLFCCWFAGV